MERIPVHYSWVVLAAATVGLAMTIPGQTVGVAVFLDSIINDLGLGRSSVSATYILGTLAGSLALPFIGRAIDREGPRRSVIAIAVAFGLACTFMSLVSGIFMLFVGFALIRGLGQGARSLVSIHSINIWFVRRRGLAVGVAGIGFAAATAVLPLAIDGLIDLFDWRWSYAILGVAVVAVVVPIGAAGCFATDPNSTGAPLTPETRRPNPLASPSRSAIRLIATVRAT